MKYLDKEEFEKVNMFGTGVPNDDYAKYFIGDSFLNFLVKPGEAPIFMAKQKVVVDKCLFVRQVKVG
jgi:hypothetical protein